MGGQSLTAQLGIITAEGDALFRRIALGDRTATGTMFSSSLNLNQ
jgi:hypothetical protein